jgi:putative SOS response-associated peptidase YedK
MSCNIYSMNSSQAEIVALTRAIHNRAGNLPLLPGIFPGDMAPIVRNAQDGERELVMARWGMPGPPHFGGLLISFIRNVNFPHWSPWLGVPNRCVVPWTSFCQYAPTTPTKTPTWFGLAEDRPLAAFAGIGTTWRGVGGSMANPVEGEQVFGFLTTVANAEVAPIHPKSMPVILRTPEEIEIWMTAPLEEALELRWPLPNGSLQIVARGEREDRVPAPALRHVVEREPSGDVQISRIT